MTHSLSFEDLQAALSSLGIKPGDVVFVHSDLRALGMFSFSDPRDLLAFYYKSFQEAIGEHGTLAVPAYFYEYARFGHPFDVDHSPVSLSLGSFSRYVASLPGRIRSCNPLQSVAAIGAQAEELVGGGSLSGYGVTSPWHRLRKLKGKILFIGVTLQAMTYTHYIEEQFGVPHMYCKIYTIPVFQGGVQLPGHPISAVRYLDFDIEYDLSKFEHLLIDKGHLKIAAVGKGTIRCIETQEVYKVGIECLKHDPYYFLKRPPQFVSGKIPYDGITGPSP